MGDEVDLKFGEAPGLPAAEHQKKLAKERKEKAANAKKEKKTRFAKTFYTMIDSKKIIMLTVKPSGVYRSYFGNVKKMGSDVVRIKTKKWKEAGQWVEQGMIEDVTGPLVDKMQADQAKGA